MQNIPIMLKSVPYIIETFKPTIALSKRYFEIYGIVILFNPVEKIVKHTITAIIYPNLIFIASFIKVLSSLQPFIILNHFRSYIQINILNNNISNNRKI